MQVVYHLGAHATDEDRLIRCLLRNRAPLVAAGVAVPPPGRYRRMMREAIAGLKGAPADRDMQATLLEAMMDDDKAQRLILSEPDFICIPQRVVSDAGFYGMAGRKVASLSNVFPEAEPEFHIALANPATFLPALIGMIKGGTYATVIGDTDARSLRWLPVIQSMRAALPEARLVVWCNEDTPLIWPEVLRGIADVDEGRAFEGELDLIESIMRPEGFQRLTDYLIRHPPRGIPKRRRITSAFLEKFALPDAIEVEVAMPGWTDRLVDEVSDQYDADVAAIAAIPGVEFIWP
jgi:hypothetical protein